MECKTCGDVCPLQCVPEIQPVLLCSAGAKTSFNSKEQVWDCMNANVDGFPKDYLVDEGNGDYKCLNKTAVPEWF